MVYIRIERCCWLLFLGVVLLLGACAGDDRNSHDTHVTPPPVLPTVPAATSIRGRVVVADPVPGARVFLDRNGNRIYDNGEPLDISGEDGTFTLLTNPGEPEIYSVVVELVSARGSQGAASESRYLLESPAGHGSVVSPLTTLVKLEMDKNPTINVAQAQWRIRQAFGLADDLSVLDDYLALQDAQPGQALEYEKSAKVAEVVAVLLGTLRNTLKDNIGGNIAEDQQRLTAFLVTDQLLQHAGVIREALNAQRNFGKDLDVAEVITAIEKTITTSHLNQATLDFYEQRLRQRSEFWDMTPPQLLRKVPVDGAKVTIDAVVSLFFDKPLDRERLTSDSIVVTGSQGAVAGSLSYNGELRRLRFIPDQLLLPDSDYQVTVGGGILDPLGNRFVTDLRWRFSTTFDKTPPALPAL